MRRFSRAAIPLLLVGFVWTCLPAAAEDPVVPGLKMDDVAKRAVETWRKKVARKPTRLAETEIAIRHAHAHTKPPFASGTYRFDLVKGTITWDDATRGRMMEQAWWRTQLDWILREPGLTFFLAHSSLTGRETGTETSVTVQGRSPFQSLRFDANDNLVGLSARSPAPGSRSQEGSVKLTHERLGGHLLLRRYVMEAEAPGGGRGKETGTLSWTSVHGKPLPSSIWINVRQGTQNLDLIVDFGTWRVEKEARARADALAGRTMSTWERREYSLGRAGVANARCDVELEDRGSVLRGSYRWDGETGTESWQDAEVGERLGSTWRSNLDNVFRRFPLREDVGFRDLVGEKKDGGVEVQIFGLFPGEAPRGHQRLRYDADGSLKAIETALRDGTRGVLEPTWRRFDHQKPHVLAGTRQYMAPEKWVGTWTRPDKSRYTTTKTVTYAPHAGVHVPVRLEIRYEGDGVRARTQSFRFRNWKLTKQERPVWR